MNLRILELENKIFKGLLTKNEKGINGLNVINNS